MPVRRSADPTVVQDVWDAIRSLVHEHEAPTLNCLIQQLAKVGKYEKELAETSINQTLHDGLIALKNKVEINGEQCDVYQLLDKPVAEKDDKDWYCFECHAGGDVEACSNCFRVFHTRCRGSAYKHFETFLKSATKLKQFSCSSTADITPNPSTKDATDEYVYNDTLCSVCNIVSIDKYDRMEQEQLNYLLKFVIQRIQSWIPNNITHSLNMDDKQLPWLSSNDLTWSANYLFYVHKDMSVIQSNLDNNIYQKLSEVLADVLTIQHNVAIFHGTQSQEYAAAELMVRDCLHDIGELQLCCDCYRHSNEKINPKWFCLPCEPPHRLVWAKQKGYPYWPAKVIGESSTQCDVRFFGGKNERALLSKSYVKPIETPKEKLHAKATAGFNRAIEELRYHQKLLNHPEELKKVIASHKRNKSRQSKETKSAQLVTSVKSSPTIDLSQSSTAAREIPIANKLRPELSDESVDNLASSKDSRKRKHSNSENNSTCTSELGSTEKRRRSTLRSALVEKDDHPHAVANSSSECEVIEQQVTSSTEPCTPGDIIDPSSNIRNENGMVELEPVYCDSVERMRREIELLDDKKEIVRCAMICMQKEIDRLTGDHNDHLKRIFETHNIQISDTKKRQWCCNCEQDAIYHCCWNTAYCSQQCQQEHWQSEHKKVCRRRR